MNKVYLCSWSHDQGLGYAVVSAPSANAVREQLGFQGFRAETLEVKHVKDDVQATILFTECEPTGVSIRGVDDNLLDSE